MLYKIHFFSEKFSKVKKLKKKFNQIFPGQHSMASNSDLINSFAFKSVLDEMSGKSHTACPGHLSSLGSPFLPGKFRCN